MKFDQRKQSERLYTALGELDPALVESARGYRAPKRASVAPVIRRVAAVALVATLLLATVTITVFAAVPSLRGIINLPFLDKNARKDTVPDGWVGIYTVADLDRVRDDLDGRYILMSDLTFTEADGTFTPIGTMEEPFMGEFDGNGHVIRGLTIDVALEAPPVLEGTFQTAQGEVPHEYHKITTASFVGLFGYCGFNTYKSFATVDSELNEFEFPYLTDDENYRGMISNLGVEGATIKISDAANARVGVLAGQASYIAGCYVKDCTIELTAYEAKVGDAQFRLRMGGLAGNVQVMDSCYAAGCSLTVTGANELLSDGQHVEEMNRPDKATVFIGGLAGNAYTMVTSYAEGNEFACDYALDRELWISDLPTGFLGEDHPAYVGELYGHIYRLPSFMNYGNFKDFQEALYRAIYNMPQSEPLPDDWDHGGSTKDEGHYYFRVVSTNYIRQDIRFIAEAYGIDLDTINPSLFTGDFNWETEVYNLGRYYYMEDLIRAEKITLHYLGDERLTELVSTDNLKVGPHYCYVVSPAQSYTKADFAEFNFKTVWEMKDGRPVLRIFE